MLSIRLILFLIISIVSIINIISFYSHKKEAKKRSGSKIENLISDRKLTKTEAEALSFLYSTAVEAGEPVYRVEGSYEYTTLEVQNSQSEKVTSIGDVIVQCTKQLESHTQEWNVMDIVSPTLKKGALILNLNNFSSVEEASVRKALAKGEVYQKRVTPNAVLIPDEALIEENGDRTDQEKVRGFQFHTGRMISEEEKFWLFSDYRASASIFMVITLFSAWIIPLLLPKVLLAAVTFFLFFFLILPPRNRIRNKKMDKNLIVLTGKPSGEIGSYRIDRFYLTFPKDWESKFRPGEEIKVEAYPEDANAENLKVLSLNDLYSINRSEKKNPTIKRDRFKLMAILTLIALILALTPLGGIFMKASLIKDFLVTRKLQRNFVTSKEIREFPFVKGQEVIFDEIPSISTMGYDYGVYLLNNTGYSGLDFSAVKDRLNYLKKLQLTEEMLTLKGMDMDSWESQYYFYSELYPDEDEIISMEDMDDYFGDNALFQIIKEYVQCLESLTDEMTLDTKFTCPPGGFMEEIFKDYDPEYLTVNDLLDQGEMIVRNFYTTESNSLNDLVSSAYKKFLKEHEALMVNDDFYNPIGFHIDIDDLMVFEKVDSFSIFNDREWRRRVDLRAVDILESFETELQESCQKRYITGIITEIRKEDDKTVEIKISDRYNYRPIPYFLADVTLFVALLILSLYCWIIWIPKLIHKTK